jgi:hypothetical protein
MKTSGGMAAPFLTSALDGGEWLATCFSRFSPGERALTPDRRLGGPQRRSGRCEEKNLLPLPGIQPRSPARIQSLYRLSFTSELVIHELKQMKPKIKTTL